MLQTFQMAPIHRYRPFSVYKTDILQIFSFITGDKTEFSFSDDVFKLIHNWNLTSIILSGQFLAFVY